MPYLDESKEKNCFRCQHLGASDDGYVCALGFGEARTIWTGDLALICPMFEPKEERALPSGEIESRPNAE
jgi:hypothetical protein